MSLPDCLRKARSLLAGGWCEPLPRTKSGEWTHAADEDASSFDLLSALTLSAADGSQVVEAYELIESIACPSTAALNSAAVSLDVTTAEAATLARATFGGPENLPAWLEAPGRPHAQVLRLLDLALMRARAAEAA